MNRFVIKHFFRQKICLILGLLLYAVGWGFLLFLASRGFSGFMLLHTLARGCFYICFGWVCLTFYFISSPNRSDIKEASDSICGTSVYEKKSLFFISGLVLLWNAGMCLILIFASLQNDGTDYFLSWFWGEYFINVLSPQLICLLLTFCVASSQNLLRWLTVEIIFLLLISPIAERFVWIKKPTFPIDQIWKKIRWPFTILYQNGEWAGDIQGGLQMEPTRIYVHIFWLALCAALVIGKAARRKWKFSGIAVLGGIGAAFLIFSYLPASTYRLNNSWDGMFKLNWDMAQDPGPHTLQKPDDPGFYVKEYNLNLTFGRELSVEGRIRAVTKEPRKEFCFTLDDGFQVKAVTLEANRIQPSFEQKGNLLSITLDRAVEEADFTIRYAGHHEVYYAHRQGAMLPGWLPWYPMAGERQTAVVYPEWGNMREYNPYNTIPETDITLHSNIPLTTNLDPVGTNCYRGISDSITVLAGALETSKDPVVKDYLPLGLVAGDTPEQLIERQKEQFSEAISVLEQYGADTSDLQGKKILLASEDVGRNTSLIRLFLFDDYILMSEDQLSAQSLLTRMVLSDTEGKEVREASDIITTFLMHGRLTEDPEESLESLFLASEILKNQDPSLLSPQNSQKIESLERLKGFADTMDSESLMKKLFDYTLHPETYGSDENFFNALESL